MGTGGGGWGRALGMRIFCSSVWGTARAASSAAGTRDTAHWPPLSACPWCMCGVALGREGRVDMQRFGGSQAQDQVEEDVGDLKKRKRSGGRLKQGWGICRGFLSHPSSLSLTKQNLPVCVSPSGTTSWFTGSGHLVCKWLRTSYPSAFLSLWGSDPTPGVWLTRAVQAHCPQSLDSKGTWW